MPSPSDNRPDPGRRRRDSFDGLRDLQRRGTPSEAGSQRGRDGAGRRRRDAAPAAPRRQEERAGRSGRPASEGGLATLGLGRRRRWPRRTLIGVNAFVALCLVGAAGAYGYVHYQLGKVTKIDVSALTAQHSGPFTILIVGSDSRTFSGSAKGEFGSAAQTPGQRSDTIMLARVVPKTRSITLLSIPRDLFVNVAGMGQTRINSSFNNGPNLLISTIQTDLGIPINHFVEINFATFEGITDAVGGVKVWFPTPVRDLYSLLEIPQPGCVNLTGLQALQFARSRHYEYQVDGQWITQGLSDLARIQRQQFFVKKMIAKAESKLTNPVALNDVISSVAKNLTVDSKLSTDDMIGLAEDFHDADVAGIPTETLPTYNLVVDGADVLGLQQPAANQMISAFNNLGTAQATPAASATPATSGAPATAATGAPATAATGTAKAPATTRSPAPTGSHPAATTPATSAGSAPVPNYVLPGPAPTEAELASC